MSEMEAKATSTPKLSSSFPLPHYSQLDEAQLQLLEQEWRDFCHPLRGRVTTKLLSVLLQLREAIGAVSSGSGSATGESEQRISREEVERLLQKEGLPQEATAAYLDIAFKRLDPAGTGSVSLRVRRRLQSSCYGAFV